jgi:hypothetical protein
LSNDMSFKKMIFIMISYYNTGYREDIKNLFRQIMSAQKHTTKDMEAQHELKKNMSQEVDEWEEDIEEADHTIDQSVQDDWEDEEEQVRALVKKTLIEKEKENKKKAEVAGKVAAKVAAKKAKYENLSDQELDFAQFEYVRILLKTKKEKIQEDQVYGEFSLTMKASVMHAIDESSNAVSKRINKMNCAISEAYTQGGGEGDLDEIGIRKEHSKKLVKQFKTIWRVSDVIEASKNLSDSLNGFVKVGKRNFKNEVADIMAAIHNNQSVSRGSSACPTPSAYESSVYESSAYESSACATPYDNSSRQTPYESPATPSAFINLNKDSSKNLRKVLKSSTSSINSEEPMQNGEQEIRTEGFEVMKQRADEARENPVDTVNDVDMHIALQNSYQENVHLVRNAVRYMQRQEMYVSVHIQKKMEHLKQQQK